MTTPFHERLAPLNETHLWSHWSGYLSAVQYHMADKFEYFAVRNAAGLTSTPRRSTSTGSAVATPSEFLGRCAGARHRRLPRRAGAVHAVVRRAWVRGRRRRGVPVRRQRVLPDVRRTEPGLLPRPHRVRLRSRSRTSPSRLRHRSPSKARSRGEILATLDPQIDIARVLPPRPRPRSATSPVTSRVPGTPATSATRSASAPTARSRCSTPCIDGGQRPRACCPFGESALLMTRIEAGLRADRCRLPLQPLRVQRRPVLDADRARLRLDVPRPRHRRPRRFIGRGAIRSARSPTRRRAGRCVGLVDRLAGLRSALPRRRADPAEGRDAARLRDDAVRRRRRPRRLRDQLHVLPDAATPHRHGSGASRPRRARLAGQRRADDQPPVPRPSPPTSPQLPLFNPARKTA